MNEKWIHRFSALAGYISLWSKDESTKVGAVIVDDSKRIISTGYNGIPQGVHDDINDRHERPAKYLYFEHAERNAIYTAGRHGISLDGTIMFCTMFPCADCARAVIQSGIKSIVVPKPESDRWKDHHEASQAMLKEAGVEIHIYEPKEQLQ